MYSLTYIFNYVNIGVWLSFLSVNKAVNSGKRPFFRPLRQSFLFFCKKYRKIIDFYVILLYNTKVQFSAFKYAFLHTVRSESFREKASRYRI